MESWSEYIECPECGCRQWATVEFHDGDFFPSYVHECIKCKYDILESEWNEIKEGNYDNKAY